MNSIVPLNSLMRHIAPLESEVIAAGREVMVSGHFVLGKKVAAFEKEFAAYCGVSDCVGVANGTDALELALRALGVGHGSRVAVAANAAMYGTSAVLACGAEPCFVDVLRDHWTIDPAELSRVLADGKPLQAVIVTHLYGRLADMEAIISICAAHGVPVLEDCAQAHGAQQADGRKAGSLGTIASFSFYPTKNLGALGDGGAVVTNNSGLAERVRQLRQYGWSKKYENSVIGGRNSRLDEIQAAILSVMLPQLDSWNTRRRAIANRYSEEIRNSRINVPSAAGSEYVAHLYVVATGHRAELQAHLMNAGIQTEVHYPTADHRQPCHGDRFASVRLRVTEEQCESVLTLPCFPEMTENEVQQVIDACNRF